ncbi:cupin domain-containing protein [soil metagenome]
MQRNEAASLWFGERLAQLPVEAGRVPERVVAIESAQLTGGSMPPLHAHDRDETFQVLEGEVVFFVGEETVEARAGDVVIAPRDVPRTYLVTSASARWLVTTALRSLARYEDFALAVARPGPADSWPSAEEEAAVSAIASANGITLLGPPGSLPADAIDAALLHH